MSNKFHVNLRQAPPRFSPISKFSSFEVKRCLGCRRCIKDTSCIYNTYKKRKFDPVEFLDTGDHMCVSCMRCVQECKNNVLSRAENPRWNLMGNEYLTPDIIARIWKQAETGKIPVSGSGYRGPFCGPGFDQIWTDMSEIIRPTRDGIHGREYISTAIELGRKPERLLFDTDGKIVTDLSSLVPISIPMVLDIPDFRFIGDGTLRAMARAAVELETVAIAKNDQVNEKLTEFRESLIIKFDPDKDDRTALRGAKIAEIPFKRNMADRILAIKETYPEIILSIRLRLDELAKERSCILVNSGADIIHLQAGPDGKGFGKNQTKYVTELVREVHLDLVGNSIRDQITLLVSGGITMAEHVAKIILCGADGAGVDSSLMVALECRLCKDCEEQAECPVKIDHVTEKWGEKRIVNLLGSWYAQLIEVLGAMGLREVRRLRGEVGRAMFFKDLEQEIFNPIFNRKKENGAFPNTPGRADSPGKKHFNNKPPARSIPGRTEPEKPTQTRSEVKSAKSRYRNSLGKYTVILETNCTHCGKCAEACRYGVLIKSDNFVLPHRTSLCRGPEVCRADGSFCEDRCPENAIRVGLNPLWKTFGDPRWTADLITSTWMQAETSMPPDGTGLEYKTGDSGGGFDKIEFCFPDELPDPLLSSDEIDLSIPLNRRQDDNRPQVTIGFPVYGGGMSFGSISLTTMVSRAMAYKAFNSFTCSGEGGYPDALKPYGDHVITQVATGLFGVMEETIQRARIVEFKYAQGAKPGLGGHLLGDKVTPPVAKIRQAVEGSALFSPFPFHSVYSVEDHKKHVDWIKHINPQALISVKVSTPNDVDMVAVGSFYAGGHIIHIDGSYGGTGAAPDIAKKNIAMPIEYAIPKVHQFLVQEGVRNQLTLIASGGIRSAWDIAKAIALGADGVVIGTAELVALECVRCGNCESGRGCPRGIATTDDELNSAYDVSWATMRLKNLFHSYSVQLKEILRRFGLKSIQELVGKSDLIVHRDYI